MELDSQFITSVAIIIAAVITNVQSYRAGVSKAASVKEDTFKSIMDMRSDDAERYYKRLQECDTELQKKVREAMKWRSAFLHRGLEMKKQGVKSTITTQDVAEATYEQIHSNYMEISNV